MAEYWDAKVNDVRLKKDVDIFDPDPEEALLCPMCKQVEDQLHYTRCDHNTMITMRAQEVKSLQQKLQQIHTHGDITSIWAKSANQDQSTITFTANNTIEVAVQAAFQHQQDIGWHNLLRGSIYNDWNKAQMEYMQQPGMDTSTQWATKAISILQDYTLTMWNHRNNYLHGIDKLESQPIQRTTIQTKVKDSTRASIELICQ
jgi:hypothetical protein